MRKSSDTCTWSFSMIWWTLKSDTVNTFIELIFLIVFPTALLNLNVQVFHYSWVFLNKELSSLHVSEIGIGRFIFLTHQWLNFESNYEETLEFNEILLNKFWYSKRMSHFCPSNLSPLATLARKGRRSSFVLDNLFYLAKFIILHSL